MRGRGRTDLSTRFCYARRVRSRLSKMRRGFWGDVVNSPYVAAGGVEADDARLFEIRSKQQVFSLAPINPVTSTASRRRPPLNCRSRLLVTLPTTTSSRASRPSSGARGCGSRPRHWPTSATAPPLPATLSGQRASSLRRCPRHRRTETRVSTNPRPRGSMRPRESPAPRMGQGLQRQQERANTPGYRCFDSGSCPAHGPTCCESLGAIPAPA